MQENRPLAALASLLIPGSGQHILGRHKSGWQWLAVTVGLYVAPRFLGLTATGMTGELLMLAPGLLLHLLCIVDTQRATRGGTS